jgi:dihydrofolate reductase
MAMGKLIESTFVSLDGVIESPQEWSPPYWDDEHTAYSRKLLFDADALLLGRVTYEGFAQAWPARSGDDFTDRINSMPKYVASNTLQDVTWNARVISGDVAAEIARLKQDGSNLLKYGTGVFDRTLMQHRLVDQFHLWHFPVIAGKGQRLFEGFDVSHLKLVDSTKFGSGIVVHVYEPQP